MKSSFPIVPASFFGMVLGLLGLGSCWRVAAKIWDLPTVFGETIMLLGSAVWTLLILLFLAKWFWQRSEATAELKHPVMCCFIGLAPVTGVLVAIAIAPYSRALAIGLFIASATGQTLFSLYRTGLLWQGGRDPLTTTPVLYLPTVAGNFVSSIGASALGYGEFATLFFGAGLFSWLAIESIIIHRLLVHEGLAKPLRPTMGIQLAPPVVACAAYLAMTKGHPDLFAQMLIGYGLLQALLLARMLPWLCEQAFGPSYWAFTFGVDGLALSLLRFVERGMEGPYRQLAIIGFVAANAVVGGITIGSLVLIARRKYLPPTLTPVPAN